MIKRLFIILLISCLLPLRAIPAGAQPGVRINEIAASASPYKAERGYDWVELHNTGSRAVPLAGWTLSAGSGKTYTFPRGARIGAGGYLVAFCTDEAVASSRVYEYVTGFNIPAMDASVILRDADGALRDEAEPCVQFGNITYGRAGDDGAFVYFPRATRGQANPAYGYSRRAEPPVCDTAGGFYSAPVTVAMTASGGSRIVYTLDGSTPAAGSTAYERPLVFSETAVLRAAALSDTMLPSETVSATYFIMPQPGAPVVSLMTDAAYLTDEQTGLLARGSGKKPNYSQDWEYPMQLEYFDSGGRLEISQICGFQVSGGLSRVRKQKSLAFFARKAYGSDAFPFDPFPNREYASVKCFTIRTAGTESPATTTLFRDAMLAGMAIGTYTTGADGIPVLVYLNGQPYGAYILRERLNKHGIAAIEGLKGKDADGIDLLYMTGHAKNGSNADYAALSAFMRGNDLNAPQNLDRVLAEMDLESYFDYVALMMITGNEDVHNALFYRLPGGKWKWVFYDADGGFRYTGNQPITRFLRDRKDSREDGLDHVPFSALMEVPAMKDRFLKRMGVLLDGLFREEDFTARAYRWRDAMLPLIPFQAAKWGNPASTEAFAANVEDFLSIYRRRMPNLLENIQACFRLSDKQMELYFGAYKAAQGIR